jgi:hypothetical protein
MVFFNGYVILSHAKVMNVWKCHEKMPNLHFRLFGTRIVRTSRDRVVCGATRD